MPNPRDSLLTAGHDQTVRRRVASPRLVGRRAELALLDEALARAELDEPTMVVIAGEAGIGKSRLVAEVAERAAARDFLVLAGGCVELCEGGVPFAPVVEALRRLRDQLGADQVEELLGTSVPELGALVPGLLGEDAASSGPLPPPGRLLELLLGLVGHLSATAPVLLIIEDLHWADRSTLDLLTLPRAQPHRPGGDGGHGAQRRAAPPPSVAPGAGRARAFGRHHAHRSAVVHPRRAGRAGRGHHRRAGARGHARRAHEPQRGQPVLHRGAGGGRGRQQRPAARQPARHRDGPLRPPRRCRPGRAPPGGRPRGAHRRSGAARGERPRRPRARRHPAQPGRRQPARGRPGQRGLLLPPRAGAGGGVRRAAAGGATPGARLHRRDPGRRRAGGCHRQGGPGPPLVPGPQPAPGPGRLGGGRPGRRAGAGPGRSGAPLRASPGAVGGGARRR